MATASGWLSFRSLLTGSPRRNSAALLLAGCLAAPLAAQQAPPPAENTPIALQPPPETPLSEQPPHSAAFMTLLGATDPNAPPPAAEEGDEKPPPRKGLQWTVGDYVWKFGGYIKVDLIHDFDDIGDTDAFDVRTIPTTGEASDGSNTRLHARQTRFNMDVRGPLDDIGEEFHGFVEGDFFGTGNSFRMRHAYGEIGPYLAGQTWSTFLDDQAMPETLDFESPIAFPQIRQTQFRFTQKGEDGDYWAVSIEDPDSDVSPPAGVTGVVKEPYPDLNARMHWENRLGHVHVGLFGGAARFEPDTASKEDAFLWGINLATKLKTCGEDSQNNAILQATYGDGVGRYRGGLTAGPNSSGNIEAIPVLALMACYQHFWSEKYRSNIGYAWADANMPGGMPATSTEEVTYGFVNLIWQFSYRAWTGVEFLHGTRETFDGFEGDANRLQFSVRFDI